MFSHVNTVMSYEGALREHPEKAIPLNMRTKNLKCSCKIDTFIQNY
jgi:hypothetical protein